MTYCSTAHTTQKALLSSRNRRISTSCWRKAEYDQAMISLLLKQKSQAVWGMGSDKQREWHNRQGNTNQNQAKQGRKKTNVTNSLTALLLNQQYQKVTVTTTSTQCLYTIPPFSEQIPNQAGHSLKKDQAWGTWYALLKMKNKWSWNVSTSNNASLQLLQLGRTKRK